MSKDIHTSFMHTNEPPEGGPPLPILNDQINRLIKSLMRAESQNTALLEAARYVVAAHLGEEPMTYPVLKLRAAIEFAKGSDK